MADTIAEWAATDGTVGIRLAERRRERSRRPGVNRCLPAPRAIAPGQFVVLGPAGACRRAGPANPEPRWSSTISAYAALQPPPPDAWADLPKVLALAHDENVVVKISGACTLSHEKFPYDDIWDPIRRIFDAFGLERCMWGTDWTRAAAVVNYEQGVKPSDHRSSVGQRPRHADGRGAEEDLRLVSARRSKILTG